MEKIIKEARRKGNSNETLVLFIYEDDDIVGVDLDVITEAGRVKMARTKPLKGRISFLLKH